MRPVAIFYLFPPLYFVQLPFFPHDSQLLSSPFNTLNSFLREKNTTAAIITPNTIVAITVLIFSTSCLQLSIILQLNFQPEIPVLKLPMEEQITVLSRLSSFSIRTPVL